MWHHLLINRVRRVCGSVGVKILSKEGYTEADIANLEEWQQHYVHGLDGYLYGMVLESIDRDEKWGQALLMSVTNDDYNINGAAGRLVDHIMRSGTHLSNDQAKVRLMEIDSMQISLSDKPEDVEITCTDMLAKWDSIPAEFRGHPHIIYENLLNLFPTVCAADKKSTRGYLLLKWGTLGSNLLKCP